MHVALDGTVVRLDGLNITALYVLICVEDVPLLDPFDSTTGSIAPILQCPPPLLHLDNLIPGKPPHFQRSVQIPHGDGDEVVVG